MTDDGGPRWHETAGTWSTVAPMAMNPKTEIQVEGGPGAPPDEVWALLDHLLPDGTAAFEAAHRHLEGLVTPGDWYPDGATCRRSPIDGHPEIAIHLTTEADVYGAWEVTLRSGPDHPLTPVALSRRQD